MGNWGSTGADFSACRTWRYRLWRQWAEGNPVLFIMLNPSTADENVNDPTVERCRRYAETWGYGGLVVCNLFAYRSKDPAALRTCTDPIGPENDRYVAYAARGAGIVVCAWGEHGSFQGRDREVLTMIRLRNITPHYLRLTKAGNPCHPLYLPKTLQPREWEAPKVTP